MLTQIRKNGCDEYEKCTGDDDGFVDGLLEGEMLGDVEGEDDGVFSNFK